MKRVEASCKVDMRRHGRCKPLDVLKRTLVDRAAAAYA